MGRKPCCEKMGLKRGPWAIEEDHKLMSFILNNGIHCWRMVPRLAGLLRCGKSCRLRWVNYLRPDLKRGAFTEAEEDQIIQLHQRLGNRWSKIASYIPGRTDNEIKNHWNTRIKKKLKLQGLDPVTHKLIEPTETNTIETTINYNVNQLGFASKEQIGDHDALNYDLLCQNLDMGMPMSQKLPNSTQMSQDFSMATPKPSFSIEDSTTTSSSKGESPSMQGDCIHQWVDQVDSLLSWDGFLHDDFLFMGDDII